MRECWNWQTGQTKDLVVIAIVWVQVPSPAWTERFLEQVPLYFFVMFCICICLTVQIHLTIHKHYYRKNR